MNLGIIEIKAFIPAKNFEVSKQFYQDLGFKKKSDGDGIAYFAFEEVSFLLQDCSQDAHLAKLEMHILVKNVDDWYEHIKDKQISEKFSVTVSDIEIQPWRMKEFILSDPSGVIWRVAQNI
ncbi:MAG: glyoxalase [Cytophagales bacterium]|nr:MAG: glyoxalase [Cytophagales bacterium]